MLLFFFIWSIFAKTDKIIASTGKIVSSGKNINISPLQDAIIRSIDVKLGATIKKGDVLVGWTPPSPRPTPADFKKTRPTTSSCCPAWKAS